MSMPGEFDHSLYYKSMRVWIHTSGDENHTNVATLSRSVLKAYPCCATVAVLPQCLGWQGSKLLGRSFLLSWPTNHVAETAMCSERCSAIRPFSPFSLPFDIWKRTIV